MESIYNLIPWRCSRHSEERCPDTGHDHLPTLPRTNMFSAPKEHVAHRGFRTQTYFLTNTLFIIISTTFRESRIDANQCCRSFWPSTTGWKRELAAFKSSMLVMVISFKILRCEFVKNPGFQIWTGGRWQKKQRYRYSSTRLMTRKFCIQKKEKSVYISHLWQEKMLLDWRDSTFGGIWTFQAKVHIFL